MRMNLAICKKMKSDFNNRVTLKAVLKNDYKLARKKDIFDLVSLLNYFFLFSKNSL